MTATFHPSTSAQLTDAKLVEYSRSRHGYELATVEATIHRFVLAELNTHRDFSRNSQSSRAIPVVTQLDRVAEAPAFPLKWACEQAGMSGGDELTGHDLLDAQDLLGDIASYTWNRLREYVDGHPNAESRLHKSLLNRPMEWFSWHRVIITSSWWDNFYSQRCSAAAQPEFAAVAYAIRDAIGEAQPDYLEDGDWHLPYVTPLERNTLTIDTQRKISASRCAGVSYLNHDRDPDVEKDLERYDRLMAGEPKHWSPLEHVATPFLGLGGSVLGNFNPGWQQFRHLKGLQ